MGSLFPQPPGRWTLGPAGGHWQHRRGVCKSTCRRFLCSGPAIKGEALPAVLQAS